MYAPCAIYETRDGEVFLAASSDSAFERISATGSIYPIS